MIEPATRHVRLLLSFAILALFLSQSLAARCRGPRGISKSRQSATDRPVTPVPLRDRDARKVVYQEDLKELTLILPQMHITRQPVNDEISRRWFDSFIEEFDRRRMCFTLEDINRFSQYREKLDDHARQGDLSFAVLIRNTYARRLRQTTGWGEELLAEKHDFTTDEQFELKPAKFLPDDAALRDRWRRRVKYDLLEERLSAVGSEDAVARLRARYRRIARENALSDDEELFERYLDALARTYDPHTRYIGERTLILFRE